MSDEKQETPVAEKQETPAVIVHAQTATATGSVTGQEDED